jgi:hypothetical protein
MSFDALPEDVKQILQAQQQQITRLSKMIGGLSEAVLASTSLSGKVHEHAVGQAAAFQVFAEILIAISPELRHHIRVAMERILASPDTTANEHLRSVVEALRRAASEDGAAAGGHRPGLHLVPPADDPGRP